MKITVIIILYLITSNLVHSEESIVNPVVKAAVAIGAKAVNNGKHEVDPGLKVTDSMALYTHGLAWPDRIKYKWNDDSSPLSKTLYSIDFTAPIELITESHYNNKALEGCIVIADTDHGQLVVPPSEINAIDPIIWFLDNDDDENGYKSWMKRKMTLSKLMSGLTKQ